MSRFLAAILDFQDFFKNIKIFRGILEKLNLYHFRNIQKSLCIPIKYVIEHFLVKFAYSRGITDITVGHLHIGYFSVKIIFLQGWSKYKVLYIDYNITIQFVVDFGIS